MPTKRRGTERPTTFSIRFTALRVGPRGGTRRIKQLHKVRAPGWCAAIDRIAAKYPDYENLQGKFFRFL